MNTRDIPTDVRREVCGVGHDPLQENMCFRFLYGMKYFHAVSASDQLMEISPVFSESVSIGYENQGISPAN
jgi:hypothetical protein